jgi:hypothetical protein
VTIKIILTTLLEATNPFTSNQFLCISLWQDFLSEKPAILTTCRSFTENRLSDWLVVDDCIPNIKQNTVRGACWDLPSKNSRWTKLNGREDETSALLAAHRLIFWVSFFELILTPSWKIMRKYLKLFHRRFLPCSLKLIINWSTYQSTIKYISYWQLWLIN